MNAPDFQNAAILDPPSTGTPQRPLHQRRLVVVIAGPSEEAPLASRVRSLAQAQNLCVLLFGVCRSASLEPELRRRLATTAAFLNVHGVPVEFTTASGAAWLHAVNASLRADDQIACFTQGDSGLFRGPFSDVLSHGLDRSIHDMSGLRREPPHRSPFVSRAAVWLGSLFIIAVFGVLEARLAGAQHGLAQTILLLLLIIPELGLLLGWNSLFP